MNEPSRKKAVKLIEDRTTFNRLQINKAWAQFKLVSPIAAGVVQALRRRGKFLSIRIVPERDDLRSVIDGFPDKIVVNAAAFQDFALNFKQRRSRRTLLPETEMWLLPSVDSQPLEAVLTPLASEDLDALERVIRQPS